MCSCDWSSDVCSSDLPKEMRSSHSGHVTVEVSPFWDPSTLRLFANNLIKFFPQEQDAIAKVLLRATEDGTALFNKHMYCLCLAATLGEYNPPAQWIGTFSARLQKKKSQYKIAQFFAFVTIFAPKFRCGAYLLKLLLPSDTSLLELFFCCGETHPFFASLFLGLHIFKDEEGLAPFEKLLAMIQLVWQKLEKFLGYEKEAEKELVQAILIDRDGGFSEFISKLLIKSGSGVENQTECDAITSFVSHQCPQDLLSFHCDVLRSQCLEWLSEYETKAKEK